MIKRIRHCLEIAEPCGGGRERNPSGLGHRGGMPPPRLAALDLDEIDRRLAEAEKLLGRRVAAPSPHLERARRHSAEGLGAQIARMGSEKRSRAQ